MQIRTCLNKHISILFIKLFNLEDVVIMLGKLFHSLIVDGKKDVMNDMLHSDDCNGIGTLLF